jgi:transposase
MILLAADGWSNDEIAATLHTRREIVSLWRKRFFQERLAGLEDQARPGRPRAFPPTVVVQVKALACELPATLGAPLSRFSVADVAQQARQFGLVATISDSTVWRWLNADAIRPWQHRCWIFPRDPQFAVKAGRILDLYERRWQGQALRADEFVLSTDEKTSIQARARGHPSLPPAPGAAMRVEAEYERRGAWAYLAALDVHRAKVFGRCERKTGIAPFDRLVEQVMRQFPYNEARRVFWIMDNGSSHRGAKCVARLQDKFPRLVPVHGPVHASWLNQIEIYFSIVQRKVLTPNDFGSLAAVEERLLAFQDYYQAIAQPFA